jgi:hypothetical protein
MIFFNQFNFSDLNYPIIMIGEYSTIVMELNNPMLKQIVSRERPAFSIEICNKIGYEQETIVKA